MKGLALLVLVACAAFPAVLAATHWQVETEPVATIESADGMTLWGYHQPMIARAGERVYCVFIESYGEGFKREWSLFAGGDGTWRRVYTTPRQGELNQPPSLVVDAEGIVHVFAWPDGVFTHYRFDLEQGDAPLIAAPPSPYEDIYPYAGAAINASSEVLSVASAYEQNTFVAYSPETNKWQRGRVARHPEKPLSPSRYDRQAYPFVVLSGRAAHVFSIEDIADPAKIEAGLSFVYSFRNLQYYYSPDVFSKPFARLEVANVEESGGWTHNDDLLVDSRGTVHLLYRIQEREGDWGRTRTMHAFGPPGGPLAHAQLSGTGEFNLGRLWESPEGVLYALLPRYATLHVAALAADGTLAEEPVDLGIAATGWNNFGRTFLASARASSRGAPFLEGIYAHKVDETTTQMRYFRALPVAATAVEQSAPADFALRLEPPHPNPFNASALIRFQVPGRGPVRLEVINMAGQRVRTLVDAVLEAGPGQALWQGRDNGGQPVAAGVYIVRLVAGDQQRQEKLVYAK